LPDLVKPIYINNFFQVAVLKEATKPNNDSVPCDNRNKSIMVKKTARQQEYLHELPAVENQSLRGNTREPLDTILSNIEMKQQVQKALSTEDNNRINGIVVGTIVKISKKNIPMVDFECNTVGRPLTALSTVPVLSGDLGREVALGFVSGNRQVPMILGYMFKSESPSGHEEDENDSGASKKEAVVVEKDGETVTISAEKQIVLKCGESSITLTRAGKVLINGKYVSSRSAGVNRIKGGSVQIN
jgi:hypothetical protein